MTTHVLPTRSKECQLAATASLLHSLKFPLFACRWSGEVRDPGGGEAVHGGVVARHGAGDGRLQDQAERHPGAVQGGHQAHVRLVSAAACRRGGPDLGANEYKLLHRIVFSVE